MQNAPEKSGAVLLALLGLMIPLIVYVDIAAAHRVDTSVFYLVPICLAAWRYPVRWGIVYTLVGTYAWALTDIIEELNRDDRTHPVILIYNYVVRMVVSFILIAVLSRLRRSNSELRRLARTDFLTGAANGRYFYEAAELEFERARRSQRPLTLAYLDLDNFKLMNDTFGHSVGDELLRELVGVFTRSLRRTDLIGRLGGDEFALLLPETGTAAARATLERARDELLAEFHRRGWPVTLSVGAVTYHSSPPSPQDAAKYADDLMYGMKASGKDGIRYAEIGAPAAA